MEGGQLWVGLLPYYQEARNKITHWKLNYEITQNETEKSFAKSH